jgi:lia operon protein LiaG
MHRRSALALVVLPVVASAAPAAAQTTQRFTVTERQLEIYDAAGTVTLRRGSADAIVIIATRAGPDGAALDFGYDHDGPRAVFRVVFPLDRIDRIAEPAPRSGDHMRLHLRPDGTFGNDRGEGMQRRRGGETIEIGGSSGFRGWGNLEIEVPAGREVTLHLAAGHASLTGVSGDYTLDTWGADVEAADIEGRFRFDTGSGDVRVSRAKGTMRFDTGSGDCVVDHVTGDLLDMDTGSGDVRATDVDVESARLDTGSGDVVIRQFRSRRTLVDTGSGDVELAFAGGPIDDLSIDTGSGDVTLTLPPDVDARLVADPGSGGIDVNRPGAIFERRDDDHLVLRFGQGRGRIKIDSGSGGVTIR